MSVLILFPVEPWSARVIEIKRDVADKTITIRMMNLHDAHECLRLEAQANRYSGGKAHT